MVKVGGGMIGWGCVIGGGNKRERSWCDVGKIRERKKESEGEDCWMGEMDGSGVLVVIGVIEGMERGIWR